MDNLKFFANKGPAICTLVYVLPILIPIVVIAFAWFYKPGKDALKEKVNSFLEDPEFVRWRGFFSMCLAIYTILEIIKAWTELGKLDLQSERPNRCLPFFDRVAAFQSNFANTSALYEYGQDSGIAKVRLCTDAPESAVLAAFNNITDLSSQTVYNSVEPMFYGTNSYFGLSDKFTSDCTWDSISKNCTTSDHLGAASALVPTCQELLQTPPLPNGFWYKSDVDEKAVNQSDPECKVKFKVQQMLNDKPLTCNFTSVFRLKRESSPMLQVVLRVAVGIPFFYFLLSIYILLRTKYWHDHKIEIENKEAHRMFYAFAMESPIGSIVQLAKCDYCAFPPDDIPQLTLIPFLFSLLESLIEAIGIPIVAVYGCAMCNYPDIYVLMLIKICQCIFKVYDFCTSEPKTEKVASDSQL